VSDSSTTEPAKAPLSNLPEQSVSELSASLKRVVEDRFGYVRVRGELAGVKPASSGHIYLRLKDESAVLDAVIWRGVASRLAVKPEDGLDVIATGKITTYPGRSSYQIVIEQIELAGEGALLKMLEDRRKRLAAEGLFDPARKRKLPFLPEVVGIVTSPTGAVIRDMLHRIAERFPRRVLLWPVAVQGEGAAAQIAAAIEGFSAMTPGGAIPRPDVLIVARGGGSLEDLMAFNEESVVRAAAASTIPLISAVGHETDTTLIDYAADLRAPTPTAAAEFAVPVRAELLAQLLDRERRLVSATEKLIDQVTSRARTAAERLGTPERLYETRMQKLDDWAERLPRAIAALETQAGQRFHAWADRLSPASLRTAAARLSERLAVLAERLPRAASQTIEARENALARAGALLNALSYERVLERGFAVIHGPDGAAITRAAAVEPGSLLAVQMADGRFAARAEGEAAPSAPKSKVTKPVAPKSQGSLF
jgi:exodeoxyribonuclease VII large subunit